MKVLTIFNKDLKIISRNWIYFIILVVCPISLILISGTMLNSNSLDNIKIGVIDKNTGYSFDFGNRNLQNYNSLERCLADLTEQKASICIYSYLSNSSENRVDIYVDNTKKVIEFYAKQFVLQKVINDQSEVLERTSEEVNSKITLFSTSIVDAKRELNDVYSEMDSQEIMLKEYKQNVTRTKADFDAVYIPLKNSEAQMNQTRKDLNASSASIDASLKSIQGNKTNIESQARLLQSFLSSRLGASDYNIANGYINSILLSTSNIQQTLTLMQASNKQMIAIADNFSQIMLRLDEINVTLTNLNHDLDGAIADVEASKIKVRSFISRLDSVKVGLDSMSQDIGSNHGPVVVFKNAFNIPDNPVLFAFPLLIAIIITFTSVVLSNLFILNQINASSYLRDIITPTRDISFLVANYFINLFFTLIQVATFFAIGIFWFGVQASGQSLIIALIIFLAASIFIFVGMSLAYLVRSQSLSMLLAIFFVMVVLIFSDLLVPSSLAGPIVKFFIDLNPFVILQNLLFDVMILGKQISSSSIELYVLGGFFVLLAVITYLAKKINNEMVIE